MKNVWLIRYIWALLNEREALGRSVRGLVFCLLLVQFIMFFLLYSF